MSDVDDYEDLDEAPMMRCKHKTTVVLYKPGNEHKSYEDVLAISIDGEPPLIFDVRTTAGFIERIITNLPYAIIERRS